MTIIFTSRPLPPGLRLREKRKRFLPSADFTSSPYLHLDQDQQDPGTCHARRLQKAEANHVSKDKICC